MSSFSFRGTDLDSLGIVTLVSDFMKMPKKRGENILIPFRSGRVFIAKYYEERPLALGLEIVSVSIAELETAIDTVKALLGPRTLGALQLTMSDGSVRIAQAEYVGDLNPVRISPVSARMVLEFNLPDPFFYDDDLTSDVEIIDASPSLFTINNPGTVEHRNPTIQLHGPLENTVIANTTSGVTMTYTGAIAGGETVVIETNDTGEYIATKTGDVNVIGNITHSGSSALMIMSPGDNAMSVTDEVATTGSVEIEFYAPYL